MAPTISFHVEQEGCLERGRIDGAKPFYVGTRSLKDAAYRWHNQRTVRLQGQAIENYFYRARRTNDRSEQQ